MAHGGAREGNWRGNMRMEWAARNLALYRKTVYPALLPLMRTHRLPAADWTEPHADLNGLVRFAERPNLVSARVPSRFERALLPLMRTLRLNWLVRLAQRRNLVSANVSSHFKRSLRLNVGRASGEASFICRNVWEVIATSSFRILTLNSKLNTWTLCTESKPETVPS